MTLSYLQVNSKFTDSRQLLAQFFQLLLCFHKGAWSLLQFFIKLKSKQTNITHYGLFTLWFHRKSAAPTSNYYYYSFNTHLLFAQLHLILWWLKDFQFILIGMGCATIINNQSTNNQFDLSHTKQWVWQTKKQATNANNKNNYGYWCFNVSI